MAVFYQNRSDNYYIKIGYNTSFPSHLHKQIELFYIVEGSMAMTIGEHTQVLTPGMISICFPNIPHQLKSLTNTVTIPLIFDMTFVDDFSYEFLNLTPSNPFVSAAIGMTCRPLFDAMMDCSKKEADARIVKGLIYQLLGILFSNVQLIKTEQNRLDVCQRIFNYIDEYFTQEITLSSLSDALGYNKYYISHIFNDRMNVSFTEYLSTRRLEYARSLLLYTNEDVTDIAFSCGFNSLRTFYRAFKARHSITPSQYRVLQANDP